MTSRLGKDLFGAGSRGPVDGASAAQDTVGAEFIGGGTGGTRAGRRDGAPDDVESVAGERALTLLDSAGDDPLHPVPADTVESIDADGARVLDSVGVDTVDDVGAVDAVAAFDGATRKRTAHQDDGEDDHNGSGEQRADTAGHADEGSQQRLMIDGIPLDPDTPFRIPRWMKAAIAAVLVLAVGAVAFAVLQPIKVLPQIRLAPGFAMTDQRGELFTSEDTRGAITLYTFVPGDCAPSCAEVAQVDRTMATVRDRVPVEVDLGPVDADDEALEVRYVTIMLDDSGPADDSVDVAALADAAALAGADGEQWRFVTSDARTLDTVVGLGFGRQVDAAAFAPAYVIVDGWGTIRGEYRYETLAERDDTLVRHIGILVDEVRNSSGLASLAYGAAHMFMCYP